MDAGRRAHLTGLVEINGKHRLGVNHRVGDQHRWPCQPLTRRRERTHLMRTGAARLVFPTLEVDAARPVCRASYRDSWGISPTRLLDNLVQDGSGRDTMGVIW
jgi:hypothetical protein